MVMNVCLLGFSPSILHKQISVCMLFKILELTQIDQSVHLVFPMSHQIFYVSF